MENVEKSTSRKRTFGSIQQRESFEHASQPDSTTSAASVDYVTKRQRNNVAVNKTREKKRKEEEMYEILLSS